MADPVSIVSGVAQVLFTCINLCQSTTHLIDQIQNAPQQFSAVSSDLQAFCTLLGTAQSYLNDEDARSGLLHQTTSSDIRSLLKHCLTILRSFYRLSEDYMSMSEDGTVTTSQPVQWTWKEHEILQLRDQLSAHEITLNVAIAAANLINTTKTEATTARIEQDVQDLKSTLAQLLARLNRDDIQFATEAAVVETNYKTTIRRIANDAASVLSSVNPNEEPALSFNIDRVVSTLASRSTLKTAPLTQFDKASNPSPDLEYTGSFYQLSLRFHGTPVQVEQIKKHFQQQTARITTTDLAILCQTILQELTTQNSPGARMDFYFYQDMFDLPQLRDFFCRHMGFTLPGDYHLGDFAALSPHWVYWLHSLADTTYSGVTKTSMSEDHSNRWRMTFMRHLEGDPEENDSSSGSVILHRPTQRTKDARLPDVYGYSTYWKELRDQLDARKEYACIARNSPQALTGEA